ncbi:enterotoxin [Paraburkholderia sp. SARCC-3016]|uniref:enterotoxin n=1 Tax=Paraburkholderia sp. SARCC-3016 TaxID=3058611 RepID=UPI00280777F8|nr:enterotoxin [Paraburkholderia sp. SARCC-3016]MDQ7981979.1 enterotoxin [Paraburkholderia sp. SARCC-3016]
MQTNPTDFSDPGCPVLRIEGARHTFGNAALALQWRIDDERFHAFELADRVHARTLRIAEPFTLSFADRRALRLADLLPIAPLRCEPLPVDPLASRVAGRIAGVRVTAMLRDVAGTLRIEWSVEQHEGSPYLRMHLAIGATVEPLHVHAVSLLETEASDARATGIVDGSPVCVGNLYLGCENPLSQSDLTRETTGLRFYVARALPIEPGKTVVYSTVAGIARDGQLRRDFASYLERERAHPSRAFLHYNSWFDIGYLTRYTQAQALERIAAIGHALHDERGVTIDGFMFDDGWDDYSGSWAFSNAFPHGFEPLRDADARYGAAPGVWLSPWGGYGPPRDERVARGAAAGFETVGNRFALSGERYYRRFHQVTMDLVRRHGIRHFKFDGTGNANRVFPGSRFDSDWDAAIELIGDIRREAPDAFINLSTGTLPSPFWLRHADTIWRGGEDFGFAGTGSEREQWITYRDTQIYRNVVLASPLFPLDSLMLHGIICAQENRRLDASDGEDFVHDVRSFFGSGTQLQELYVTPSLLGGRAWDTLAAAAIWARGAAVVLRDNHWIGGAPDELDVYGWAAWTPSRAIVTLRNPDSRPRPVVLDLRAQLELPAGLPARFAACTPWSENSRMAAISQIDADCPPTIDLAPFEVLTLELQPLAPAGGYTWQRAASRTASSACASIRPVEHRSDADRRS